MGTNLVIVSVSNGETEVSGGDGIFFRACLPGTTTRFSETSHRVEVSLALDTQSLVGALIWDSHGDPFYIVDAIRRRGTQCLLRIRPLTPHEVVDLSEREYAEENPKKLPPPWWERL